MNMNSSEIVRPVSHYINEGCLLIEDPRQSQTFEVTLKIILNQHSFHVDAKRFFHVMLQVSKLVPKTFIERTVLEPIYIIFVEASMTKNNRVLIYV